MGMKQQHKLNPVTNLLAANSDDCLLVRSWEQQQQQQQNICVNRELFFTPLPLSYQPSDTT